MERIGRGRKAKKLSLRYSRPAGGGCNLMIESSEREGLCKGKVKGHGGTITGVGNAFWAGIREEKVLQPASISRWLGV